MNAQLIKRCWAIHDSPALNEIKARGQWEAARGFILAEANASLKRVYPLELAAEKFLSASAGESEPTLAEADAPASQPKERQ
jgi:hypothetical protein